MTEVKTSNEMKPDDSEKMRYSESIAFKWVPIVLSILALIVSVRAEYVSSWLAEETVKHQRLTIRPRLDVHMNLAEEAGSMGIVLENTGLGPAVIRRVTYGHSSTPGKRVSGEPEARDFLRSLVHKALSFGHASVTDGTQLPVGETIRLLTFDRGVHQIWMDDAKEALSGLIIEVDYEDLYGTKYHYPLDQKSGHTTIKEID